MMMISKRTVNNYDSEQLIYSECDVDFFFEHSHQINEVSICC